jgi:hypothetical protein
VPESQANSLTYFRILHVEVLSSSWLCFHLPVAHCWMNRFRRILIRWEKKVENYFGMLHLTEEQPRRIAHLVAVAPLAVHPSSPLLEAALEIAMRTGRMVYDSLYLALAVQMDGRLNKTTQRGKRIEESPDGAGSYRIQKPAVDCQ